MIGDLALLAYIKSLFPCSVDRIQSVSKVENKLFLATDDDRRFILKLSEVPVVESTNIGEHQTLFYIDPETKEPVLSIKPYPRSVLTTANPSLKGLDSYLVAKSF